MGSKTIEITHVVNPHQFYFKYKNQTENIVSRIEQQLLHYVSANITEMCASQSVGRCFKGDYVGVHAISKSKWIRAVIDVHENDENEVIAWAIDYGFPIKTELNSVIILNDELKKVCQTTESPIVKGGIADILSATYRVDVYIKFL